MSTGDQIAALRERVCALEVSMRYDDDFNRVIEESLEVERLSHSLALDLQKMKSDEMGK